MKKYTLFFLMIVGFSLFAFQTIRTEHTPESVTPIPEYTQRTDGDALKGWDYLRYGNYIGAGVPYKIFRLAVRGKVPNHLNRTGKSKKIPHVFNTFMENGVEVVGGLNCFGCHSGKIDGEFIAGIGSTTSDYTLDNGKFFRRLETFVKFRYGKKSGQYKAFLPLARGSRFVEPYIGTPFKGINPAFKLEEAAVAHRNPADLTWANDEQTFPITSNFYASDVPPLWNVKKKNALYYNGMGRGDFTKLLMQVMVVAIEDSTEAREINNQFNDVLAWLNALEAPKFPKPIDTKTANFGKRIFEDACSKCHGTYGKEEEEYYPNVLVGLDVVQTDSFYALYSYKNTNFINWLNSSWIMTSEPKAWVQPELGYIAPPLDGIWATAPYLHNGSIPNLEALLNSKKRPTYWHRTFNDKDYDFEKIGWKYKALPKSISKNTYDTTIEGYGNYGHNFGDDFTDDQRMAVIEYLKTL